MSSPFGEGDPSALAPAVELSAALRAAEFGVMPAYTSDQLLAKLGLDGEEPDGRTVMDRLVGEGRDVTTLRSVVDLNYRTAGLIEATNSYEANEAQEAWASLFGTVVSTQIRREGDICPGAREIALMSTRDDIVAPEIRAMLQTPEEEMDVLPPHLQAVLGALMERLFSGDIFSDPRVRESDMFGGRIIILPLFPERPEDQR